MKNAWAELFRRADAKEAAFCLFLESSDYERVDNKPCVVRVGMTRSLLARFEAVASVKVLADVLANGLLYHKASARVVDCELRNVKHHVIKDYKLPALTYEGVKFLCLHDLSRVLKCDI